MSLTSHLKNPQSPVYQFLHDHFPNAKTLASQASRELKDVRTIRPLDKVPYPYPTIGIAIDYRLRYYFALTQYQDLVAWRGAGLLYGRTVVLSSEVEIAKRLPGLTGEPTISQELVEHFFVSLDDMLSHFKPVGKRLEKPEEELIARYCIVLALFEEVFRAKVFRPALSNSPLFKQKYDAIDSLLAIAQPHWVDDICELSWLFHDGFSNLFSATPTLNPNFDGSSDIGGADADLILDGHLLDIKATINARIESQWIYQLIGYVLLDYSDKYQLHGLGFYMARQGLLLKWSLPEFLKGITGEESPSLVDLRLHFQELLYEMQRKRQEGLQKFIEKQEWHHRQQQAKWAREVVRRWPDTDPETLPKRQRKSLQRAIEFLEQYEQEKAQRQR